MHFFQPPTPPINTYSYFVRANPTTSFNPITSLPKIEETALLSPFSFVLGDVTIGDGTFIAPFVSLRADEGTPFYIGNNSNLQDGVVVHGLLNEQYKVNGKNYSVFIGDEVSCAHGSLVHGPAVVENRSFIGFKALVYHAWVGEGSFISTGAAVLNGVRLRKNSFVPPYATIDTQKKADSLITIPKGDAEFAEQVQRVNKEFPPSYSLYFGKKRCSCGLACG